jgi:hypothetical protein
MRANDKQVGHSSSDFMLEHGAPDHLTTDSAAVQVGPNTRFVENSRRAETKSTMCRPSKDQMKTGQKDQHVRSRSDGAEQRLK